MNIKFRINITLAKPVAEFDGKVECVTEEGVAPNRNSHRVVKSTVKSIV